MIDGWMDGWMDWIGLVKNLSIDSRWHMIIMILLELQWWWKMDNDLIIVLTDELHSIDRYIVHDDEHTFINEISIKLKTKWNKTTNKKTEHVIKTDDYGGPSIEAFFL